MAQSKSSQDFVPIREVRDGIVVLKDGSLRAVVMASSLNFALKSEEEQTAIILQFQGFLNSLDFSVQFFIQSRELDIRPYISLLEERFKEQTEDLMRIQVREYIEFIKTFVESTNIMTKNFFVVIPYTPAIFKPTAGTLARILPGSTSTAMTRAKERSADFEESRSQLEQRVSVVEQGLVRSGVRIAPLGTEEVIELFYKLFNPGELEKPIPLETGQQ
jgi:type IV secretory pathway VirB4 component